jgi:hypothetical protein
MVLRVSVVGSRMAARAPVVGASVMVKLPPCAAATSLTRARPTPNRRPRRPSPSPAPQRCPTRGRAPLICRLQRESTIRTGSTAHAGSPVGGLPAVPPAPVTVPVRRRYETEDVTIPAGRNDLPPTLRPTFFARALPPPLWGPPDRRSTRGLTRDRELRRFNDCEEGKPDLAPFT